MNLDRVIAVRNTKTVYRDGNKCIKVFNAEYSKADVFSEALNQARMEELGLNVPKVFEVTMIGDKWAIVSEFVKGKTLARLMEENPQKKSEYISLLVDLQMSVHAKTYPMLNKLKDTIVYQISETEYDATTICDLHAQLEDMPKHNKVCHGDFNPTNVIINDKGVPYIIDWSHLTQGNASADVARTYIRFCINDDVESAELYLDIFCNKSDTSKEYVKKWVPIVSASLSYKCNDKEREFFAKNVENVK